MSKDYPGTVFMVDAAFLPLTFVKYFCIRTLYSYICINRKVYAMKKLNLLLLFIILVFLFASCSKNRIGKEQKSLIPRTPEEVELLVRKAEENPDDRHIFEAICNYFARTKDHEGLRRHAKPAFERCLANGHKEMLVSAGAFLGSAYIMIEDLDSMMYYLNTITPVAEELDNAAALTLIYNSKGIYVLRSEMDYSKSMEYFRHALKLTEKTGKMLEHDLIMGNIALIYYFRNDPDGLQYALRVYDLGKNVNDDYVIFNGAILCARMHYLSGKYDEALHYIYEALRYIEGNFPFIYQNDSLTMFYSVYADILGAQGKDDAEAEHYYLKAFESAEATEVTAATIAYMGYGYFLLDRGRLEQAKNIFARGIDVSENKNIKELRHELYLGLSRAHGMTGNEKEALKWYMAYHEAVDSLFTYEKERYFNSMLMKYETERYHNEIQKKELELAYQSRKVQIVIFILILVFIVMGGVYMLYRRKNRMYRQLVKRHQDSIRRERLFREKERNNGGAEIPDAKGREIFENMERLMLEERVFVDKDISVDKLAEMLNTNRAYISRIINQYAGMPFSNYINSRRMEEAVAILSDPDNDVPLKVLSDNLGYNSISSFYRSFQKETGVPPSKYREEVRKLKNEEQSLS